MDLFDEVVQNKKLNFGRCLPLRPPSSDKRLVPAPQELAIALYRFLLWELHIKQYFLDVSCRQIQDASATLCKLLIGVEGKNTTVCAV